jgi:eukaryotic-like serine/threonine-protein kinase
MNTEQREAVAQHFDTLSELPEDARERELAIIAATDQDVARELRELLRAHDQPDVLLRLDEESLETVLLNASRSLLLPYELGRYVLRELIDEGGMGAVYLADDVELKRTVAIKFLHPWSSEAARTQFPLEQQTLARLTHPHITPLYVSGTTKEDGDWFAMEYVGGASPITDACISGRLTLEQRLKLFLDACDAVAYAHGNLTVHLDLKPANILVAAGRQVKLVDFGIARNLDRDGGTAAAPARGAHFLSLGSASPEQRASKPLDVQADVYGLGCVLYELLADVPPYKSVDESSADFARRLDVPPSPPSVARRRDSTVRASKIAWRELDAICLRALEHDPARRYESVSLLHRDLAHFLAGNTLDIPIGVPGYRLRKFARRHWVALATLAAASVLIAAVTLSFTFWLIEARDRAVASEASAVASEASLRSVNQLVLSLFEGDDIAAGPSQGLRVVDLLERGALAAEGLDESPKLQADLRFVLGRLFHNLGRVNRGEPLLAAAWKWRQKELGAGDPQTIEAQVALGAARMDQEERLDEAERNIRDALTIAKARKPVDAVEVASIEGALGRVLVTRGDYPNAVPVLEGARRVLALEAQNKTLSEVIGDLANTRYYMGDIDAADVLNRSGIDLDRKLFGDHHPNVGVGYFNLGNIDLDRGDYRQAETNFGQAHDRYQRWYGLSHPKPASTLLMLGRTMAYQGRLPQAADYYEQALSSFVTAYGQRHRRVASVLSAQGDLARDKGNLDEAERLFTRAAEIFEALGAQGRQHEFYLHQQSNLATVQLARRRYAAAEALLRPALEGLQKTAPSRYTALAELRLAAALVGLRRFAEAEDHALKGYTLLRKNTGPASAEQQEARRLLLEIYQGLDKPDKIRQFQPPVREVKTP